MIHTKSFAELPNVEIASALLDRLAVGSCHPAPFPDLPLVLYGRGKLGHMAQEYLEFVGHKPVAHIEYEEPTNTDSCVAVCIVTSPYAPIERKLLARGFRSVVPFYDLTENFRNIHPLSNGWFADVLTDDDKGQINKVMMTWGDDVSRAHHLQFIAWRALRQEWTFETAPPVSKSQQFFIFETTSVLHDHEVFVDAGAHHGETTMEFIRITEGKFNLLMAYEPDRDSQREFRRLVPKDTRIEMIPYALHEKSGDVVKFHSGLGHASQISETGGDHIYTYALDSFHLPATFIKMHLEGSELAVLKGAKNTLLGNRPIIAVTVCHNDDGLWRTASWLMSLLENYRFLFRLHNWCGSNAVIYAIPNERYS